MCRPLRRPVWCAVAWAGLRVGLCRRCLAGRRLAAACGRARWCLGLWSRVGFRARGWAHLPECVARGLFGLVPTAAVFMGLGTTPLPAGDARCSRIALAVWCCGLCRCAARLDAPSCQGLCGAPARDGARTPVVHVLSAACCPCGELTDSWGVEVDGLEDVEAARLCGTPTPDGARARTFVALVAAVARDRGGRVVIVAVLRVEEEELWCRAPPAIILATAALPYVPRRWDVRLLGAPCKWCEAAGEGYALPRGICRHQPLGRPFGQGPAAVEEIPPFAAMGASATPIAHSTSPTSQPKTNGRRPVRVTTVVVEVHGGEGAPTV